MNFIQPSIDPVILSIGFIEIRWYSLAYILGFLLGIYIIKRLNVILNKYPSTLKNLRIEPASVEYIIKSKD